MTAAWLEWARPGWVWSLVVPLLWLVLARFGVKPRVRASATTRLWAELASERGRGSVSMRLWRSPVLWLVALALALAACALAGPRRVSATEPVTWQVLCDPSAAAAVPYRARPDAAIDPGLSRVRRAAQGAAELLAELWRPGDRALWSWGDGEPVLVDEPRLPPAAFWGRPPGDFAAWHAYDRGDCLWVGARVPSPEPLRAGVVASGGAAVPGPVAWHVGGRLDWDGEGYVEVRESASRGAVVAAGLPPVLQDLVGVWARARGLAVVEPTDAAAEAPLLTVVSIPEGPELEVPVGRDGWTTRVAGAPLRGSAGEPWLSTGDGTWVRCGRGRIESGIRTMDAATGDPAAFAVSWAELLDESLLAPPGVFSRADRSAAGPGVVSPPRHERAATETRSTAASIDAWLALGSGLATVLAVVCGRRRL